MESSSNISTANQAYLNKVQTNNEIKQTQNTTTNPVKKEEIKDGDKKSMNALKWAGIIAAGTLLVGGTIYAVKKGKTAKLDDIKFEKGTATLKEGGEKFSGTISDTTKGGKKIKMTYKDGVLQSSTYKGENKIKKAYDYAESGELSKVVKNRNEIDISKAKQEAIEKLD